MRQILHMGFACGIMNDCCPFGSTCSHEDIFRRCNRGFEKYDECSFECAAGNFIMPIDPLNGTTEFFQCFEMRSQWTIADNAASWLCQNRARKPREKRPQKQTRRTQSLHEFLIEKFK